MVKNAQEWLNNLNLDKNTATSINLHKTTLGNSTILTQDCEDLTGEIVIEDFVKLTEINFERHQKSTTLISGGTIDGSITKITIKNCPNLKTLDLDNNEIAAIVFEGNFNELEKIDANNNLLNEVDVGRFLKLKELELYDNANLSGKKIKGVESATVLESLNAKGVNGNGFNGEYLREWRDAIKNLLDITTNDLPDTWNTSLTSRLGGKKLTDIPTGKTLKDLIDNFSSDKDILQQQLTQAQAELTQAQAELTQAQAELNNKQDYDAIKAERDNLQQQLQAIKNELGVGANATQEKIIAEIQTLKGRPTSSDNHTDYDAIKTERDSLKAENASLKNGNKENLITKRVMIDTTNDWGLKLSGDQKNKISEAASDKEAKTHWDKIVKEEVTKLKDENSSSTKLNIGLGILAIGSLLVLGWVLMKQQTNLPQTEPEEEKEKNKKV